MAENLLPLFCYHNKVQTQRRQILFVTDKVASPRNVAKVICKNVANRLHFKINTFAPRGIQMNCEVGAIQSILKNEGVWEKIENLKPIV